MLTCLSQVSSPQNLYSERHDNAIIGLNPIVERFLHELRMRRGKTVLKRFYHAVLTREEFDELIVGGR